MRAIALITTVIAVIMSTTNMQAESRRFSPEEQTLVDLSNRKWQWMADKNVTELAKLFHREATFVHMGGTWGKERELAVIADGFIWYKHTEIHTQEAKLADGVGFVYSDIQMTSEVGGREVSFPFMVSEVYVRSGEAWQLAALIFTRTVDKKQERNE